MNVSAEEAYRIACQALGEAIVSQRVVAGEMARLAAENERLTAQQSD